MLCYNNRYGGIYASPRVINRQRGILYSIQLLTCEVCMANQGVSMQFINLIKTKGIIHIIVY